MGSYSDSSSDLEEELPVFDFLSQAPQRRTEKLYLDSMVAEEAAIFSAKGIEGECKEVAHVISSESDEDSPYVSLAMRLKHSRDNAISASSAVTNVKYVEKHPSSNVANTQLSCQTNLSESEDPLSRHQVRTVEPVASKQWLPLRPLTSASLSKRKPAKCTEEDIQASRQEALKRRQARERQQRDKEALRQEQERQKAERKALAEAAKALRPEECMKHMVVAVDPGKYNKLSLSVPVPLLYFVLYRTLSHCAYYFMTMQSLLKWVHGLIFGMIFGMIFGICIQVSYSWREVGLCWQQCRLRAVAALLRNNPSHVVLPG